ncbi:MAG: hypothetical protein E6Z48_15480 [Clostridium butyricum]|nr:hypothetical protein [Clostridium butyricum]
MISSPIVAMVLSTALSAVILPKTTFVVTELLGTSLVVTEPLGSIL